MSADTKIDPNGGVAATDQLADSALKSQRDHREDQVNWKHAPDWAAVYAVQNRFGNTSAKWWGAIGDHAADGPQDQDQSTDAPVYFELNAGEPIKMFHRPKAEALNLTNAPAHLVAAAYSRSGGEGVHFTGHNQLREGENPMVGKVSGYRQLSDDELALVNDIKALGPLVESLVARALAVGKVISNDDVQNVVLAKTNFKQGAMWLIRAVDKPQGFF